MTNKKILVFNSYIGKDNFLNNLFTSLEERGCSFSFLLTEKKSSFHGSSRFIKNVYFGPWQKNFYTRMLFILSLAYLAPYYFLRVAYWKMKKKTDTAILVGWNEKIFITPILKIFKIKTIWIEKPSANYMKKGWLGRKLYKLFSKRILIVAFSSFIKDRLTGLGVSAENIRVIHPGIKIVDQELIRKELETEETEASKFKKNFFTIGTVTELYNRQNIESLFLVLKICSEIIPNIQLIVVGDGQERKDLAWTAKKMGIESLVWMVGEHGYMRKWLNSFNVFIASSEVIKMADVDVILKCMAAGLPIIAPRNQGLEDFVEEEKTGYFIDIKESEMLARRIINLYQEKNLRMELGRAGQKKAEKYFDLETKVDEFEIII